ncbi:hypothetical protein LCGC14_2119720 [marine sediment metagenome]|uniref:Uncharacterized protein n=1 Tax=marine sediment metagenome TaxID=412755 RepID=A0A0F9GHQ8_9ZZZZ
MGRMGVGKERVESLEYTPTVKDTTDLEAGTTTITVTSEASGVGNADYNAALTLLAPDDARLVVLRIAARLQVTIDSFDTATELYCRVYVDVQDADHRLFDETFGGGAGAKLAAEDTLVGTKETIFNLLRDGAEHTFYFFFWIDQATNAVISVVQLEEGVGTQSTSGGQRAVFKITHSGLAVVMLTAQRQGSGTGQMAVQNDPDYAASGIWPTGVTGSSGFIEKEPFTSANIMTTPTVITKGLTIQMWGSVATDINILYRIKAVLQHHG